MSSMNNENWLVKNKKDKLENKPQEDHPQKYTHPASLTAEVTGLAQVQLMDSRKTKAEKPNESTD